MPSTEHVWLPGVCASAGHPLPNTCTQENSPSGFHPDFDPTDPSQRAINQPADAGAQRKRPPALPPAEPHPSPARGPTPPSPLPLATCVPCSGTVAPAPCQPPGMLCHGDRRGGPQQHQSPLPQHSPGCSLGFPRTSLVPAARAITHLPGKPTRLSRHRFGSSWQPARRSSWGACGACRRGGPGNHRPPAAPRCRQPTTRLEMGEGSPVSPPCSPCTFLSLASPIR